VALVHRPRYDDWSWSKGKLDPGEQWPAAAVREVQEETGLTVRLGRPLPAAAYTVLGRDGTPATKQIRYWAAEVVGGDGALEHEIDEVAWLDVAAASDRLTYARDREQLRGLVRADHDRTLTTWPLLLIRHAKATPRSAWSGADHRRPLDSRGRQRAQDLVPLLGAFGVTRIVSSPSTRCTQTVAPYAGVRALPVRHRVGLSEEGYAEQPDRAVRHLSRLLERGHASALCTHGPVLPELLEHLRNLVGGPGSRPLVEALIDAVKDGLDKGEALVAHVAGTGATALLVDVERYAP